MLEKPTSESALGIVLSKQRLYGVRLSTKNNQFILKNILDADIDEGNVKPLYIEELSEEDLIVSPLTTGDVLTRQLTVKLGKDSDVTSVLSFQAEPFLPYPPDEAILDWIKSSQTKDETELTLLSARKESIANHLEQLERRGINPEVVTCSPAALMSFCNSFLSKEESSLIVIHFGVDELSYLLLEDGVLAASQSAPGGINLIRDAYAADQGDDFPSLQLDSIRKETLPQTERALEALKQKTAQIVLALKKKASKKSATKLAILGPGATLPGAVRAITGSLEIDQRTPDLDPILECDLDQLIHFALPIGAALSCLEGSDKQINFRREEFRYPTPWKRFKKTLQYFGAGIAVLTLTALFLGNAYLNDKTNDLKTHYTELVQYLANHSEDFGSHYFTAFPKDRTSEGNIANPAKLAISNIEERLSFIEKEIASTPQTYPLQPNTPMVSDLLAWLALLAKEAQSKAGEMAPIEMESLSYTMVKYPEASKKNERYQVKVDLDFKTASPQVARAFQDALEGPQSLIDPRNEPKITSSRGQYHATFFLKDQTLYSSE